MNLLAINIESRKLPLDLQPNLVSIYSAINRPFDVKVVCGVAVDDV